MLVRRRAPQFLMPTGSLGHGVCNLGFLLWGFVGFRLPGFVSTPDVNYGCSVYAFLSEALVVTNNLTPIIRVGS